MVIFDGGRLAAKPQPLAGAHICAPQQNSQTERCGGNRNPKAARSLRVSLTTPLNILSRFAQSSRTPE
jgi:hypothetical protein